MIQFPKPATTFVQCANGCGAEQFQRDDSHRFGVGLSHYRSGKAGLERSYVQVFSTPHSCSHDCAVAVARQQIAGLPSLPRGTYSPDTHNPAGEHSDAIVQGNVEYNREGVMPAARLPKACAVCGADLTGKDVFIPHVDHSTLGTHYQDVLLKQPAYAGRSVADVTLGACSQDHAVTLAHAILNEVLLPHAAGQPVAIQPEAPPEEPPAEVSEEPPAEAPAEAPEEPPAEAPPEEPPAEAAPEQSDASPGDNVIEEEVAADA